MPGLFGVHLSTRRAEKRNKKQATNTQGVDGLFDLAKGLIAREIKETREKTWGRDEIYRQICKHVDVL